MKCFFFWKRAPSQEFSFDIWDSFSEQLFSKILKSGCLASTKLRKSSCGFLHLGVIKFQFCIKFAQKTLLRSGCIKLKATQSKNNLFLVINLWYSWFQVVSVALWVACFWVLADGLRSLLVLKSKHHTLWFLFAKGLRFCWVIYLGVNCCNYIWWLHHFFFLLFFYLLVVVSLVCVGFYFDLVYLYFYPPHEFSLRRRYVKLRTFEDGENQKINSFGLPKTI